MTPHSSEPIILKENMVFLYPDSEDLVDPVSSPDVPSVPPVRAVGIKAVNKEERQSENHYMLRSVVSHTEQRAVQSPSH